MRDHITKTTLCASIATLTLFSGCSSYYPIGHYRVSKETIEELSPSINRFGKAFDLNKDGIISFEEVKTVSGLLETALTAAGLMPRFEQ